MRSKVLFLILTMATLILFTIFGMCYILYFFTLSLLTFSKCFVLPLPLSVIKYQFPFLPLFVNMTYSKFIECFFKITICLYIKKGKRGGGCICVLVRMFVFLNMNMQILNKPLYKVQVVSHILPTTIHHSSIYSYFQFFNSFIPKKKSRIHPFIAQWEEIKTF